MGERSESLEGGIIMSFFFFLIPFSVGLIIGVFLYLIIERMEK